MDLYQLEEFANNRVRLPPDGIGSGDFMTQRRLRLGTFSMTTVRASAGITNHVVVAISKTTSKQTRCSTCDATRIQASESALAATS